MYCNKYCTRGKWAKPCIIKADPDYGVFTDEYVRGHMVYSHPKCNALALMSFESMLSKHGLDISKSVNESIRIAQRNGTNES